MKKRKVKLFASIASLAMVVAVMGVGVWAATQQNVNVNSTVSFQTTAIEATVALAIDGDAVDTAATTAPEAIEITTATTNGTQDMNVTVVLADSHEDGMFSYDDGTIIYTFTISNTSAAVDLNYQVRTEAAPQGSHWTAKITGEVEGVLEGSVAKKDGETVKTATVTVTFTYGDEDNKYPVQSFAGDVAKLPTVKFVLQSADFE